jgi:hypothetical protein
LKLLECKTDEETYNLFITLWGNEHGGLYSSLDFALFPPHKEETNKELKKLMPYVEFIEEKFKDIYIKDKYIVITDTGPNSLKFKKMYVKTLNNLLLNSGEEINLSFRNNGGGKSEVMIAGLLPIFNNFDIKILSWYVDRKNKRHKDIIYDGKNKITSLSNVHSEITGTSKKCNVKKINILYNNYTCSASEQAIICLLRLSDLIEINLMGFRSCGLTTTIKYFEFNKKINLTGEDGKNIEIYGIEIPIGYMSSTPEINTKFKFFKSYIQYLSIL